ncbi:nuclease-related domain-containing protein [Bacillus sp. CECT 9360]|uniref:nuclease-related domain-containing protein n=1 Tax=Bacillus sp. CECT 9360 TaxID=2845821 RepID=UPI001E31DA03|nr:nuclease-related domain-containing protein [Bacillus sp. CECT 9360]CAH0344764.1 hypothetical protein BCI9360_01030 [Bacillus sp. CECT 9360]
MIVKKRELPLSVLKSQALLRRIPSNHQKVPIIRESLMKKLSGYKGENALDFPLGLLSDKDLYIFHDLRLQDQSYFFQIDTLVITQNFLLILEVKNIAGTIYFDPNFHQLIRTQDGQESTFPDPLLQTDRQEFQLKRWLAKNRLKDIPVLSLVVISNPYTQIQTSPENSTIFEKVIRHDFLPKKIHQLKELYKEQLLTEKEIKKLINIFKKQHTPGDFPILDQFQIRKEEILRGVLCPECDYLPLERRYANWFCPKCSFPSKDAHVFALKDFSLLLGSTITNNEARDFLLISSPSLATRLLRTMNLSCAGTNKGRVYYLQF